MLPPPANFHMVRSILVEPDGPTPFLRISWRGIVRRHEVHVRVNGVDCGVEPVDRPVYVLPISPGSTYEARVRAVRATPAGPAPGDWTGWARYRPRKVAPIQPSAGEAAA